MNPPYPAPSWLRNPYVILAVAIFGIDVLTKVIAQIFLPFEQRVDLLGGKSYFYLIHNKTGFSSVQNMSFEQLGLSANIAFFSAFATVLFAVYLGFIQKSPWKSVWKWLLGILLCCILYFAVIVVTLLYGDNFTLHPRMMALIRFIAMSTLWLVIFSIAKNPLLKIICVLTLAAGVGNSINMIFPPFGVIDFIFIEPLYQVTGTQICNFADIVLIIAVFLMVVAFVGLPIFHFIRWLIVKRKKATLPS